MSNNIYDILKKMQNLVAPKQSLTESKKAKPDFLDMDKDGDTKEPMKKATKEKSKGAVAEAVARVEQQLAGKYQGWKKINEEEMTRKVIPVGVIDGPGGYEEAQKRIKDYEAGKINKKGEPLPPIEDRSRPADKPKINVGRKEVDEGIFDNPMQNMRRGEKFTPDSTTKQQPKVNPLGNAGMSDSPINKMRQGEKIPTSKEKPVEESGLQAYLGKKKYGETGMKALQKAGREGASKEKMARIRAQHDKMDEGAMELTPDEIKASEEELYRRNYGDKGYFGSKDPRVAGYQEFINRTSKLTGSPKIKVDGMYGPRTAEANQYTDNFFLHSGRKHPAAEEYWKHQHNTIQHAYDDVAKGVTRNPLGKIKEEMIDEGEYNEDMLSPKQKEFAALAEPRDKITYADKIAGAKKGVKKEGNKFSGNLAKARAKGLKRADLDGDGDMEPVRGGKTMREGWEEMQKYLEKKRGPESKGGAGKKAGTRYGGSAQRDDDEETDGEGKPVEKKKGRPKGTGGGAKFNFKKPKD